MAISRDEQKLKGIMARLFRVDPDLITEDTSSETIAGWDSLRHMDLVTALEEAFGIEFTDEQILELLNYRLIKLVLKEHGVEFG